MEATICNLLKLEIQIIQALVTYLGNQYNYLARAVYSPEPDLGKAVVSNLVRNLSAVCPGLYGKSTGWILMIFCT